MNTKKVRLLAFTVLVLGVACISVADAAKRSKVKRVVSEKKLDERAIDAIAIQMQKVRPDYDIIKAKLRGKSDDEQRDMLDKAGKIAKKKVKDDKVDAIIARVKPKPKDPKEEFLQDVGKLKVGNVKDELPKIVKQSGGDFVLVKKDDIKIEGDLKAALDAKLQDIAFERIKDKIGSIKRTGKAEAKRDISRLRGILEYKDEADFKAVLEDRAKDMLKFAVKDGESYTVKLTDDLLEDLNKIAVERDKALRKEKKEKGAKEIEAIKAKLEKIGEAIKAAEDAETLAKKDENIGKFAAGDAKDKLGALTGAIADLKKARGQVSVDKDKYKDILKEKEKADALDAKAMNDAAAAVEAVMVPVPEPEPVPGPDGDGGEGEIEKADVDLDL